MQSRLLNGIDHQHPQRGTDSRNPIYEVDVDVGTVFGAVREGRGVDEKKESERELHRSNNVKVSKDGLSCCDLDFWLWLTSAPEV